MNKYLFLPIELYIPKNIWQIIIFIFIYYSLIVRSIGHVTGN